MASVVGEKEVMRRLKLVRTRVAKKAVASGVRAGLGEMRTAIRQEIPNPRVRKVVASRFKKGSCRKLTKH